MDFDLFQHIAVTLIALGAVVLIVRRVLGVVQPVSGPPTCDSCPSADAHRIPHGSADTTKPLTLVRGDRP